MQSSLRRISLEYSQSNTVLVTLGEACTHPYSPALHALSQRLAANRLTATNRQSLYQTFGVHVANHRRVLAQGDRPSLFSYAHPTLHNVHVAHPSPLLLCPQA